MCDKPRDPVEAEYLRRVGTPEQLVGPAPKTYTFTLFVQGADVLGDVSMDALYEAGCDDATFGARDGVQYGEFDREAPSISDALSSAFHAMTNTLALIDAPLPLRPHAIRVVFAVHGCGLGETGACWRSRRAYQRKWAAMWAAWSRTMPCAASIADPPSNQGSP